MSLMAFDIENVTSIISIVWPDNEWDFVRKVAYITIYYLLLGYLKDSNAAAHSVDTGIECPIYMLESTRIFTISL